MMKLTTLTSKSKAEVEAFEMIPNTTIYWAVCCITTLRPDPRVRRPLQRRFLRVVVRNRALSSVCKMEIEKKIILSSNEAYYDKSWSCVTTIDSRSFWVLIREV